MRLNTNPKAVYIIHAGKTRIVFATPIFRIG